MSQDVRPTATCAKRGLSAELLVRAACPAPACHIVEREQRLRTPAEFRRVRDLAPRGWPNRLLVVYLAPNDLGYPRVGITVSGRVGNAVVRNRVRRRLREALRARLDRLAGGHDVVVVARPASAEATWAELSSALDSALQRAGATMPSGARV